MCSVWDMLYDILKQNLLLFIKRSKRCDVKIIGCDITLCHPLWQEYNCHWSVVNWWLFVPRSYTPKRKSLNLLWLNTFPSDRRWRYIAYVINIYLISTSILKLQLYTAKSQYWLHKAGASPEHLQFKTNDLLMKV